MCVCVDLNVYLYTWTYSLNSVSEMIRQCNASEFLENLEEMFLPCYIYSDMLSICSNLQSHTTRLHNVNQYNSTII